jgi:hypothetical protein
MLTVGVFGSGEWARISHRLKCRRGNFPGYIQASWKHVSDSLHGLHRDYRCCALLCVEGGKRGGGWGPIHLPSLLFTALLGVAPYLLRRLIFVEKGSLARCNDGVFGMSHSAPIGGQAETV